MADHNSLHERLRHPHVNGVLSSSGLPNQHANNYLQVMRDKAQALKTDFIHQLDNQLQDIFDDFIEEVDHGTRSGRSTPVPTDESDKNKKRTNRLPDKKFVARRSVLTELLEVSHIKTIQHIFVAVLFIFSLNTIVYDIVETGNLKLNFELITWAFGKFPAVLCMWCVMQFSSMLIVFPAFNYWSSYHHCATRLPDVVWLIFYIIYQVIFIVLPVKAILDYELPPVSSMVVASEQIRFIMKTHSFVRENVKRTLTYKPHSDNDLNDPGDDNSETGEHREDDSNSESTNTSSVDEEYNPCPGFSQYLYFLFAPTLVYRDNYPRTPLIRWHYVFSNFIQVVGCLFYTYYIFERFCMPVFRNFGKEELTLRNLTLSVFGAMLPSTLVLILGFFAILHSWLNAFAEMMRFADRMFYKDWWNSTSFSNYYRTWNVVVHDWLYTYIYKDSINVLGFKKRGPGMLSTFLISAVAHEYVLILTFRFFYPALFLMFAGVGFCFIFLTDKGLSRGWNVFMWVALFIGNGLLMCLYSQEWYARKNCPQNSSDLIDMLIPRSWTCKYQVSQ